MSITSQDSQALILVLRIFKLQSLIDWVLIKLSEWIGVCFQTKYPSSIRLLTRGFSNEIPVRLSLIRIYHWFLWTFVFFQALCLSFLWKFPWNALIAQLSFLINLPFAIILMWAMKDFSSFDQSTLLNTRVSALGLC